MAATNADLSIRGEPGGGTVRCVAPCHITGMGGCDPLRKGESTKCTTTTQRAALGPASSGAGAPGRANGTTATALAGNNGAPGAFLVWEFS